MQKVQKMVEKGSCYESLETVNPRCEETFSRILHKNWNVLPKKKPFERTSTVVRPSILFDTLT